jgi:hypothetical protein
MTMVDTMTYVSTATQTDYKTATVTSVSVSTMVEPTTYVSTLLSTRVMDEVSRLYYIFSSSRYSQTQFTDHDSRRYYDSDHDG